MRRSMLALALAVSAATFAVPATASAQQSFNMYLGGFVPRGEDTRTTGDVLVGNLSFLSFNLSDFDAAAVGGEWLFPLSNNIDAGIGIGFRTRGVPAVYTSLTHASGAEIEQDLRMRVAPFTATVRFLPLGRN